MFFQVTATDGDKDRPENIVYFLTGQGIDTDRPDQSKFDINKTTGEIFVLKVFKLFSLLINPIEINPNTKNILKQLIRCKNY